MIQARELMVGNWLLFSNKIEPDRYVQVNAWFLRQLVSDINDNNPTVNGYYQPIPLTPEILEKAGFGIKYETKDEFGLIIENEGILIELSENYITEGRAVFYYNLPDTQTHKCIAYCKYLHQLQNLYFALTGQKLPINNLNTTN